jgi:alpha-aminoadipate carrier protein LysW
MTDAAAETTTCRCPACGAGVALPEGAVLGEVLACDHCGVELEVISLDPARLDFFEEEEK